MIIDCHTHLEFYPDKEFNTRKLMDSMKKAGIEKSLVYAGEMFNCPNEKLLEEVAPFKKNLFPIGSISPLSENRPTLEQVEKWLADKELYGLKFYPGYEYFYPEDEKLKPYLKLLEKYNQPAIFHSGDTWNRTKRAKLKYAHPFNIDDLAVDMPELKIVIAHFGYPWVVDTAEIVFKNKNIFTDCSGLVYDSVKPADEILLKRLFSDYILFGGSIDKLLFGTDWSLSGQKEYVAYISQLPLNEQQKAQVFCENSLRLFNL